jgi:hypothetical protein
MLNLPTADMLRSLLKANPEEKDRRQTIGFEVLTKWTIQPHLSLAAEFSFYSKDCPL